LGCVQDTDLAGLRDNSPGICLLVLIEKKRTCMCLYPVPSDDNTNYIHVLSKDQDGGVPIGRNKKFMNGQYLHASHHCSPGRRFAKVFGILTNTLKTHYSKKRSYHNETMFCI